jgi:hypothetical protein
VPTLPTPIQHSLGIFSREIKQEQIKGIQIGKAIIKVSLSADDMTLYVRDPKNSTQKLLDTINSFSKYSRIQNQRTKLVAFLCTSNEQIQKENR